MSKPEQGYQVVIINYKDTTAGELKQLMVTDARSYTAMGVAALPILSKCFLFQESIFSNGTIFGTPDVGVGDLEVDNTGGPLDSYRFFGFDGQQFKVYQIQDEEELLDDTTNLLFTGTLDYPEFQLKNVVFHAKNRLQEWDVPVQTKTFSGGLPDDLYSVLGPPIEYLSDPADPEATPPDFQIVYTPTYDGDYVNRLEGEDSLAGKKKPMIFGRVYNAPGICVNSSKSIYAFNYDKEGDRKAVYRINRVCDKGTDIIISSDVADAAALLTSTPAAGTCITCKAESLVIFGSIPLGDVTADIDEAPIEQCSVPQCISRLLVSVLGYTGGVDFNQGDLDRLDALNGCPAGVYLSGDEPIKNVVVGLIGSIGGWVSPDTYGVFHFGLIDLPRIEDSVATFTNDDILDDTLNRVQFGDENRGIPPYQITIKHSKVWSVLTKGQTLESVDEYIRTFMANEFRSAISTDPSVRSIHPSAPVMEFETFLVKGQRALVRNWDFQIGLGVIASPKADWSVTANGTSSAVINSLNQLVLTPDGSNKASVMQNLKNPGQFSPGLWKIGFTCIQENVTMSVMSGLTTLSTFSPPVPGDYSFYLLLADINNINLKFINASFDATGLNKGIVDNVYMIQVMPGKTPSEEAARRMTVMRSNFERFQFDASIEKSKQAKIGDVITLMIDDRFNMAAGKAFRVVGKTYDTDANEISFDVVGGDVQSVS